MSKKEASADYGRLIGTISESTPKNVNNFSPYTATKTNFQNTECYICHDNLASIIPNIQQFSNN
jgi:hypothetical protein